MFLLTLTLFLMLVSCSIFFRVENNTLYEGDSCTNTNPNGQSNGKCLSAYKCSWALKQIQNGRRVVTCSFVRMTPVVCCPVDQIKGQDKTYLESLLTSTEKSTTTDKYSFKVPTGDTSIGAVSKAKCLEFNPRPEGVGIAAVGGEESLAEEFPHMAALGFGAEDDKQWKCGGSLISFQHVLTAAHCIYSRDFGNVKYVRLGDLNIAIDTDPADPQDFTVKRAIVHPSYDSKTVKNDIAVIELDRPALLTKYVKPACLYVDGEIDEYDIITATGWGLTDFSGSPSNHLLKVTLKLIDKDNCKKQYANSGPRGQIDDARQVCAGSADDEKIMDTCQGDSGGPLQLTNYTYGKHYHIIGVTSFGKACGITNSAGIYTRVSFHLPWIESLVFSS